MIKIPLDKFVLMAVKSNPGETVEGMTLRATRALELKRRGEKCACCGSKPVWGAGFAVTGTNYCFTCMTGEQDSSKDYEIIMPNVAHVPATGAQDITSCKDCPNFSGLLTGDSDLNCDLDSASSLHHTWDWHFEIPDWCPLLPKSK